MDEGKLVALLKGIAKASDKNGIYRNLVAIRTHYVNSEGGIRLLSSHDGIQVLVRLLSKPYEKVIEVVLSILGNCCTRKECCKQAFDCGILNPLISIISNIPNASIQCRGCRLLGNLAQHEPISHEIARDNGTTTAYALSSILNESENTAVLIMVIRAIRQLWREKPIRQALLEQGCIAKIVQLLVRYAQVDSDANGVAGPIVDGATKPVGPGDMSNDGNDGEKVVLKHWHAPDRMVTKEKFNNIVRNMEHSQLCDIVGYQVIQNYRWKDRQDFKLPETEETVKLFESALKSLQMITTTVLPQVVEEIYGETGTGLKCLVYLCGETSPFRSLALKLVSNLAANPDAIDRLTACGVIKMAADLIMYASLDESEKRYCINMMCLLTKEACNRGHIRRSGALQAFMKIAKQSHEKREQSMILYALYQYRFDSLSNEILLNHGLVSFLVRILNGIIADQEVNHIRHDEEAAAGQAATPTSLFSKRRTSCAKSGRLRRSDLLFHYKSGNGSYHQHRAAKQSKLDPYCSAPESPDSGSSGYASTSYANGTVRSPSTSIGSCSPPRVPEDEAFGDDDTEIYSPVCSDHEQDDSEEREEPTDGAASSSSRIAKPADDDNAADGQDEVAAEEDKSEPAGEDTNDFDIVAYLIEDSSNAKWLDTADERDSALLPDEECCRTSSTMKPSSRSNATTANDADCFDESEMFKIELDIATAKTFEQFPMQPTLTLLWSVSKTFPAVEFVQADTLETLLKICKQAKKPRGRAFQTLANILKHVNHFLPLLKQDFVFRLHEMTAPYPAHGARCWSCDEMRTACNDLMTLFGSVGETGYGQGEIAHILRTGECDLKLRVSIIVLFVVRDTRLLHKLLFEMQVLQTVMDFILDEVATDPPRLSGIACSGITRMAQNLSIYGEEEDTGTPSEKLEAQEFDNTLTICDESAACSPTERVAFKVRSAPQAPQETVLVSKALLIEGSEVFRRMFDGNHFIESQSNEVQLQESISADGLRYFFYLIRLQTVNKLTGMAPPPKRIEASLDALSLAQKYLLPTVERSVLNIVKTLLNDDCVLNVFEWSLRNYNQELLVASTYYFLYADINGAAKCKLYRAANRSAYRDDWRRLLTETILYRVQPNADQL